MKRLGYNLLGLVLIFGLVLSACAAPKEPASAAPQKPAASQVAREQKLIEDAKKEGEVVLWLTTIGEREKVISAFQSKHPFLKLTIWDGRDTEIMARVSEEAKIGRHSVDVLLGSPMVQILHTKGGLLTEYDFPNTVGWTDQPGHKYFVNFAAAGRAVVYNTNLVSPADVPKSWDDLKSTKWVGKMIVSTSGYDTPLYWAYLWRDGDKLNWDKAFSFWGDVIRSTKPKVGVGYSGPVGQLAAGEFALFPHAATTSTMRAMIKGAPVGIAPLPVPANAIGVALVKSAPHPNAAALLLDWLTSPDGLLTYNDTTMFIVIAPEMQRKARANGFLLSLGIKPVLVPPALETEENMNKSTDFWTKTLGIK